MNKASVFSRRSLTTFVLASILVLANSALANPNPDIPTTQELFRLPKHCQAQLIEKFRGLPGYEQPRNCGVFMNHFCYGLNFLNRASDSTKPKAIRQWNAQRERTDIDYTMKHMTAGCEFSKEVEGANMRLRAIEMFVK